MVLLKLGECKNSEISEFFSLSDKNFNGKRRDKYLSILKEYCDFDIIYGKTKQRITGYNIKEIYNEGPYESREQFRKKVEDFVDKEWGKYDDKGTADSLSIVTNRFCEENGIEWKLSKYVTYPEEWINEKGKTKMENKLYHNPLMRDWWRIYGIISRKLFQDNKVSHRIYLKVSEDKLKCNRLTPEQEEMVKKLSFRYFDQKELSIWEAKELVEQISKLKGNNLQEEIQKILSQHPVLQKLQDDEKWNNFIDTCDKLGINSIVKGCDRIEEEDLVFSFLKE